MHIDIILGSLLICVTFFLLTVLIARSIKNYIWRKNVADTQKIVKEDIIKHKNTVQKHNIILNNNVSSAINSARSVMRGKNNE